MASNTDKPLSHKLMAMILNFFKFFSQGSISFARIVLLSILYFILTPLNLFGDEIKWDVDLDKSLEKAFKENKEILLDFSAEWCMPCKKMNETTFKDAKLIIDMKNYICVRIDYDENPNLIGQYKIENIPAVLKLNSSGFELSRSSGYVDANAFRVWLNKIPRPEELKKIAVFEKMIKKDENINQFFQGNSAKRKELIDDAFEGYLIKENAYARELAEAQLKSFFQKDHKIFLAYLNDERLGVRIFLGNQIVTINKNVEYDPWDNADGRKKAIEKLSLNILGK